MISATNSTNKYYCHVCRINLNCEANFALHEFNDKHCENLLRLAKNKQVKTKAKPSEPETKPLVPVATLANTTQETPTVNPSLYGYFDAQTFAPAPKEFNTEYDPYLQKLADNPFKPPVIATDFGSGKKKKKRYCELCEVTLTTVPAFQAHMTSAAHIYKLKTLGMGVSAHFVKASTDLHTTDSFTPGENTQPVEENGQTQFHCDVCGLDLNSKSQYDGHLAGRSHAEKLKKNTKSHSNVLKCYTCNVQLAGIRVFNDHKNGRKHRNKCMGLVRNGYTIPPEERPPDMVNYRYPVPALYPELYMKEVVAKQSVEMETEVAAEPVVVETAVSSAPEDLMPPPPPPPPKPDINLSTGLYHCTECVNRFTTASKLQLHLRSIHPGAVVSPVEELPPPVPGTVEVDLPPQEVYYECSICDVTFKDSSPFHVHLNSEDHAVKVWEMTMSGVPLSEIINKLTSDWNVIKPCNGKYYCWTCNVLTNNQGENKLHLEGSVHKACEKAQIKAWRMTLVESVPREDDGTFRCKLCDVTCPTLVEFNKHVTSNAHLGLINHDKKRRIIAHALRLNSDKNPGFRTKIPGLATDIGTGATERVPNMEPLEPKIDQDKNVNLGIALPEKDVKRRRPLMNHPRARFGPYPPQYFRHDQPYWPPEQFGPPRFEQRMPSGPWHRQRFQHPNRFNMRPPRNWGPRPC